MSASQASALTAIGFQLAAAIEAYELDVERLMTSRLDADLYHRIATHMDQMRNFAASLPQVSVPWVELMIRHFELTHGLWRLQKGELDDGGFMQLREKQRSAALQMREHCLQLILHPNA